MADGLSNADIADRLSISEKTVAITHRRSSTSWACGPARAIVLRTTAASMADSRGGAFCTTPWMFAFGEREQLP
jgi:DNA-binding NarL/FixJ family response regulator